MQSQAIREAFTCWAARREHMLLEDGGGGLSLSLPLSLHRHPSVIGWMCRWARWHWVIAAASTLPCEWCHGLMGTSVSSWHARRDRPPLPGPSVSRPDGYKMAPGGHLLPSLCSTFSLLTAAMGTAFFNPLPSRNDTKWTMATEAKPWGDI